MTPRNGHPDGHHALGVRKHHRPTTTAMRLEIDRLSTRVAELERDKAELELFAAVAAHELIEPLVMTEAYVALVSERLGDDHGDARRDLSIVGRGAARTRMLVETILHEARSADREPLSEIVDLGAVTRDALDMLAPEITEREARIEVEELPLVRGERTLIGCVMNNLLVNALKYSPRQDCAVRIESESEALFARISVISSGPPLAEVDRERIFGQFHRGRNERRAQGTGLGLAISRRIVERHGGTIGVSSNGSGRGNRFYFTLPAAG
jgi:signal transduction histidine kinase